MQLAAVESASAEADDVGNPTGDVERRVGLFGRVAVRRAGQIRQQTGQQVNFQVGDNWILQTSIFNILLDVAAEFVCTAQMIIYRVFNYNPAPWPICCLSKARHLTKQRYTLRAKLPIK